MALTKEERNEVAALCHDMSRWAMEAGLAAKTEDAPLLTVARLIVDAQTKGNDAVRLLIQSIID